MQEEMLWRTFAQSGRVEDYLRYRGLVPAAANQIQEGEADGSRPKTASDDRRSDSAGV